jgi:hypothetical protein
MNDEEYQDSVQAVYDEPILEAPFERDQDTYKHLLGVDKYNSRAVNKDSPRAMLNPKEMQATRIAGRVINRIEYGEKMFGWKLGNLIEFFEGNRGITDVTSRGKFGWVSKIVTANYSPTQSDQYTQEVITDYEEPAKQSALDNVRNSIPFLKKKEM